MCFDMRLEATALYAHEHGFDSFTTTNATSRWKDEAQVNSSGSRAAAKYEGLEYWLSDWQGEEMTARKYRINAEQRFYKQEYWCACVCAYGPMCIHAGYWYWCPRMHVCACICACMHAYKQGYWCMHTLMHTIMHTLMHTSVYAYACMRMRTHSCACVYIHAHSGCSYSLRDSNHWRAKQGQPPIEIGGDSFYTNPELDEQEESLEVVASFFEESTSFEKELKHTFAKRRKDAKRDDNDSNNW